MCNEDECKKQKDAIYTERNLVLATLAHIALDAGYDVGIKQHDDDGSESWEDAWKHVLFIELPTGQVSWHLHNDEMDNFRSIFQFDGVWDGHTTEDKYKRVKTFCRHQYHSRPYNYERHKPC